jgi:hypothetical protein
MPTAVHVVGLPFEDEKCLKMMKVIENIYNYHHFPL